MSKPKKKMDAVDRLFEKFAAGTYKGTPQGLVRSLMRKVEKEAFEFGQAYGFLGYSLKDGWKAYQKSRKP